MKYLVDMKRAAVVVIAFVNFGANSSKHTKVPHKETVKLNLKPAVPDMDMRALPPPPMNLWFLSRDTKERSASETWRDFVQANRPSWAEDMWMVPADIGTSKEAIAETRNYIKVDAATLPVFIGKRLIAPQDVAVAVRGQSFRVGPPKRQHGTWQSMLDFLVKPLEAQNFHVDVISATYLPREQHKDNVAGLDKMKDIFGSRLKQDIRMDSSLDSNEPGYACPECQARTAIEALQGVINQQNAEGKLYKWIVLTRHDLVLKMNLAQPIIQSNPDERFLFPFRMAGSVHANVGFYMVPDNLQVFDGKYLSAFKKAITPGWHIEWDIYDALCNQGINASAFGFVLPDVWAYSNQVYRNPMFKIMGRDEGPVAPESMHIKPPADCKGGLCP